MSTRRSTDQSENHATDNQSDSDLDTSCNYRQSRTESPFVVSSKIVKNQPTVVPKNDKTRKTHTSSLSELLIQCERQ